MLTTRLATTVSLFCFLLSPWLAESAPEFADCSENIISLETALYANGQNVFGLSRVFFPPGSSPPRFVRVTYDFLSERGELGDCVVTYVWSTSGFLIFLPPVVFRWTSLNFFYPDNELDDLGIVLPYECRGLVNASVSAGGNCSCGESSILLDALTQQVRT